MATIEIIISKDEKEEVIDFGKLLKELKKDERMRLIGFIEGMKLGNIFATK